jgi:hypothetical protein
MIIKLYDSLKNNMLIDISRLLYKLVVAFRISIEVHPSILLCLTGRVDADNEESLADIFREIVSMASSSNSSDDRR